MVGSVVYHMGGGGVGGTYESGRYRNYTADLV